MKLITLQELLTKIQCIYIKKSDKYVLTYPIYVSYFASNKQYSKEDILRGLGFVYSWMPRIISISESSIEEFMAIANKYKHKPNENLAPELIRSAVILTGGSIVAASKLLHFIFPFKFPIYDSHIYKFCWNLEKAHHYMVKKESNYNVYRSALLDLSQEEGIDQLVKLVSDNTGYEVSPIRAIEFSIFYISKN